MRSQRNLDTWENRCRDVPAFDWLIQQACSQGFDQCPKIDERIESLEAKLKQLKTLQQRKEARARTTAAKKSRGEELRRKILAGAVLLAKVEKGEFEEEVLKAWMSVALTRPEDRALFGLDTTQ
jgi:hypothetical protein